MSDATERLTALRKAASPGEWTYSDEGIGRWPSGEPMSANLLAPSATSPDARYHYGLAAAMYPGDVRLIVALVNAVPEIVAPMEAAHRANVAILMHNEMARRMEMDAHDLGNWPEQTALADTLDALKAKFAEVPS